MLSRVDRRAALASGLLTAFVVLTVLPWRYYGRLEPTFDPNSFPFAQNHSTAWTDSAWWLATAVLGVVAGLGALLRTRSAALVGAVAAGMALLSWGIRAWQVHHPGPSFATPKTVAIANFTAGSHIGPVRTGQGSASWLAAAVLILLLAVSLLRLTNLDPQSLLSGSPIVRYTGLALLIGLAVLTFLPWYRYPAFQLRTTSVHVGTTNAWTTFEIRDYWRAAATLGLVGAVAVLLKARIAVVLGGLAGLAAVGCWAAGTWQLHHPTRSGVAFVVAEEPHSITSFDTHTPLSAIESIHAGRTLTSNLSLAVLILIVLVSVLRLVIGQRHRIKSANDEN